jgi:hypothetical protein
VDCYPTVVYRLGVDYKTLITECSHGWSPCKSELASQLAGPIGVACQDGNTPQCRDAARHAALKELASSMGWPDGSVGLAERCLDGDEKACAKLAAYIAAQATCMALTAGACSVCCGKIVGPLIELVWPVLGPFVEGVTGFVVDLGTIALEALGLKDEPEARDWANPMMHDAEKQSGKFIVQWLEAIGPDDHASVVLDDGHGDIVDDDRNVVGKWELPYLGGLSGGLNLPGDAIIDQINDMQDGQASSIRRPDLLPIRVAPPMKEFRIQPEVNLDWTPLDCLTICLKKNRWFDELWMPTNWGIIKLPAEKSPFGWSVDLKFSKFERDDAYKVASARMAQMYEVRLRALSTAAAEATGMVAAIRQARIERDSKGSSSSIWPWVILAAAAGAGAFAWSKTR